jgi:serine/threonine protein kinase
MLLKQHKCSRCDSLLPGGRWDGVCPKCLARVCLSPLLARRKAPHVPRSRFVSEDRAAPPLRRLGDYDLEEVIGRGGASLVWRARQRKLNRLVALKLLRQAEFARPENAERFRLEAGAVASLRHPHIVKLLDFGEEQGQPWISMELVEGATLADRIRERRFSAPEAAGLLKTIAEAIAYAHAQGILHRDLKPSNIMLDREDRPQVTDFGLAKRFLASPADGIGLELGNDLRPRDLTLSGQLLGTPNYSPPEQLAIRAGQVGPASDVYSLGAVLYEVLTGQPPFQAPTVEATLLQVIDAEPVSPRLLNPNVPPDLETIALKCLEKDPASRYSSAQALADELGRFLRGEPILARPVGMADRFARWCRRNPGWATAGALSLVLLVSASVVVYRVLKGPSDEVATEPFPFGARVPLQNATATLSQNREAPWPVSSAIDGEFSFGGWSILGHPEFVDDTHQQAAVFETASNIGFAEGSLLTFRLTQHAGGQRTLGRFRLSVTTDSRDDFADGLPSAGDVSARWMVLDAVNYQSANGATLEKLRDGSILASGSSPETDVYIISAFTALTEITGVRLEVLAHRDLPASGPGRRPEDGNFVLTELELGILPRSNSAPPLAIDFDRGSAELVRVFQDTQFIEAHWEAISISEPPGDRVRHRQVQHGPAENDRTGSFLRVFQTLGNTEGPSTLISIHLNTNQVYVPSADGPIAYLDYSELARTFQTEQNTFGASSTLALRQNGKLYLANFFLQPTRDLVNARLPSPWKQIELAGLQQRDFRMIAGPLAFQQHSNPDFSTNGAPIVFGFGRRISTIGPSRSIRKS